MISDALSELVDELDHYLDSQDWCGFYGSDDDPLVGRLRRLREEAYDLRRILDTPPAGELTERERISSAPWARAYLRRLFGV